MRPACYFYSCLLPSLLVAYFLVIDIHTEKGHMGHQSEARNAVSNLYLQKQAEGVATIAEDTVPDDAIQKKCKSQVAPGGVSLHRNTPGVWRDRTALVCLPEPDQDRQYAIGFGCSGFLEMCAAFECQSVTHMHSDFGWLH